MIVLLLLSILMQKGDKALVGGGGAAEHDYKLSNSSLKAEREGFRPVGFLHCT